MAAITATYIGISGGSSPVCDPGGSPEQLAASGALVSFGGAEPAPP